MCGGLAAIGRDAQQRQSSQIRAARVKPRKRFDVFTFNILKIFLFIKRRLNPYFRHGCALR